MEIKGFIQSSLLEWEGKIASVVFLPGCNLRCRYCHAASLVLHPELLETVPPEEIFDYLRKRNDWLDGVVITGGEPTLHGEEMLGLICEIRSIPLQIMIETNGTRPEWIGKLLGEGLLDAVSMDVKAPLTVSDYERVTGVNVDVNDVRHSIRIIKESGPPHEFRITLVPGLVGRDELERMLPELEGAAQIALQNFKPDDCLAPPLREVTPFAPDEMDAFERLAAPVTDRVVVRGRDRAVTVRAEGP